MEIKTKVHNGLESPDREGDKPYKVLLYSGGLDSFLLNQLIKPDINLVLPHGSMYDYRTLKSVERLKDKIHGKLIIDDRLKLGDLEHKSDSIIPCRNLYFLTIASHYGNDIYFGKVLGDHASDKTREFFKMTEDILNYNYQESKWTVERKIKIHTPFENTSKSQLIKQYLDGGGDPKNLLLSESCYGTNDKPCGRCKSCFLKWVALDNNGIDSSNYYEKNPWESEFVYDILKLIDGPGYHEPEEDREILNSLSNHNLFAYEIKQRREDAKL